MAGLSESLRREGGDQDHRGLLLRGEGGDLPRQRMGGGELDVAFGGAHELPQHGERDGVALVGGGAGEYIRHAVVRVLSPSRLFTLPVRGLPVVGQALDAFSSRFVNTL